MNVRVRGGRLGREMADFVRDQRRTMTGRLFRREIRFETLSVADRS